MAEVVAVKELHTPSAERSCIHVELNTRGSNIKYTAGDHVGICSLHSVDFIVFWWSQPHIPQLKWQSTVPSQCVKAYWAESHRNVNII